MCNSIWVQGRVIVFSCVWFLLIFNCVISFIPFVTDIYKNRHFTLQPANTVRNSSWCCERGNTHWIVRALELARTFAQLIAHRFNADTVPIHSRFTHVHAKIEIAACNVNAELSQLELPILCKCNNILTMTRMPNRNTIRHWFYMSKYTQTLFTRMLNLCWFSHISARSFGDVINGNFSSVSFVFVHSFWFVIEFFFSFHSVYIICRSDCFFVFVKNMTKNRNSTIHTIYMN